GRIWGGERGAGTVVRRGRVRAGRASVVGCLAAIGEALLLVALASHADGGAGEPPDGERGARPRVQHDLASAEARLRCPCAEILPPSTYFPRPLRASSQSSHPASGACRKRSGSASSRARTTRTISLERASFAWA